MRQAHHAARDVEHLAVDVPRLIRGEVDDHRRNVLRVHHSAAAIRGRWRGCDRRRLRAAAAGGHLARGGRHRRRHARARARRDRVRGHAVAAEVAGEAAGHADDAGLRRAVVRLPGVAAEAGDGGEADDAAEALLAHEHGGRLGDVVVAVQVDGDHVTPLILGHVEDHAVAQDAGHVDHDVDAAVGVEGLLDHALAALDRGDGVVVRLRVPAGGFDLPRDLIGRALVAAGAVHVHARVVDDHVRAQRAQQQRDLTADAASGAGEDRGSSIQCTHGSVLLATRCWLRQRSGYGSGAGSLSRPGTSMSSRGGCGLRVPASSTCCTPS